MTQTPQPILMRSPMSVMGKRETDILRTLGRLGPMDIHDVQTLILPGVSMRTQRFLLRRLADRGLIWRLRTQIGTTRNSSILGLTTDGRDQLIDQEIEPVDGAAQRLIVRDRRAPPPSEGNLRGDLAISSWCAGMLAELRKLPMLVGVACQTHWTTFVDEHNQMRQTLDAGLVIFIDSEQKTYNRPPASLPWIESIARKPTWKNRAWALIVDNRRQSAPSIRFAAEVFPVLHQKGIYNKLMYGMPRPVILVPPGGRLATVADLWRDAWPETPALISTLDRVNHPSYGPLWGTYRPVKNTAGSDVPLLEGMVATPDQWAKITRTWTPDRGD